MPGLTSLRIFTDGSQVDQMVRAGRIQEVAQYCETDVLNTYRLWLIYELFREAITPDQFAFSESQARAFVQTRKENQHLRAAFGAETDSSAGPPKSLVARLLSPLTDQ
jgi:3'-5' exonuclease